MNRRLFSIVVWSMAAITAAAGYAMIYATEQPGIMADGASGQVRRNDKHPQLTIGFLLIDSSTEASTEETHETVNPGAPTPGTN